MAVSMMSISVMGCPPVMFIVGWSTGLAIYGYVPLRV